MYYSFTPRPRRKSRLTVFFVLICTVGIIGYKIFTLLFIPAPTFVAPYTVSLTKGESVGSLAAELYSDGALKNVPAFKIVMRLLGGESHLSVGEYYFDRSLSLVELALRFSGKNFGITRTRVTIPEGFRARDIAVRMSEAFHTFTAAQFESLARPYEGYLFPDTYLFFPTVPPEEIVQNMMNTFNEKTKTLQTEALAEGKSWKDVVILASIIEKEASGKDDREIISGILWKRLTNGIALQVDASALYAPQNSQYDTYKNKGLPPTPIANPGIASLTAALRPHPSNFLYYLHDKQGNVHYASTFKEHEANIQKYLR
jgi:UPF0755 protein